MDRRTLLRGGLALAGGALMPAAAYSSLDDLAARTHLLRRRQEEARPGAVEAMERHAATLSGLLHWNPRPGLGSVVADACAAAAMVTFDAGRPEAATRWATLGREVAEDASDPDMYALNSGRLSRMLLDARRSTDAVAVLRSAEVLGGPSLNPYTQLFLQAHLALASASAGEYYASAVAVDRADIALDQTALAPKTNWARTLGPNWLASWRALSALTMERPHLAEAPAQQVLARAPARLTVPRAEARMKLAEVAWARDSLDEACLLLKHAAPVFKSGGADRQLRKIHNLRKSFTPHSASRHVRELDEVLRA